MKKIKWFASIALLALASSASAEDVLRLSTDGSYPPFSEMGADGKMSGFDIDIGMALCEVMNRPCEFVQIDWDGLIPALKARKVDAIVASMNATAEREKSVTFSDPYYYNPGVFARQKGSNIELSKEGLKGKVIGVLRASTFDEYATKKLSDFATIKRYNSQDDANLDAKAGRVDVLFADKVVVVDGFLKRDIGKDFELFGDEIDDEAYFGRGLAIAVRKGEQDLADAFSQAIKTLRESGKYKEINDRYFDFDLSELRKAEAAE